MPSAFSAGLDSFNNPASTGHNLDTAGVLHSDQHANANDAIEALEAKVGVDGSAVTTSLDYLTKIALPKGSLGYVTWTGPNNEAYSVDAQVTGLTKTVTVAAGRRIRVSVRALVLNDANPGRAIGTVLEDGVVKDRWMDRAMSASDGDISGSPVILTPTAGAHTYTAKLQKNTGAGALNINVGAVGYMLIEDIGLV